MAKVYFRYAAMNAGKSTQLLQVRHNYHERHQRTILLKPRVDYRDGQDMIRPRIGGIEAKVDAVLSEDSDVRQIVERDREEKGRLDCVLVDEAQFLKAKQIRQLCEVADFDGIPIGEGMGACGTAAKT